MALAEGHTVTHHPREQTMRRLCHRGSALHCSLTGQRFGVWSAGKESHIPEEGREPARESEGGTDRAREEEEVAGVCEVSSWPPRTPQGTFRSGTQGRLLSSYYTLAVSHTIALKFQSQEATDI